jgi:hypothetical protein
MKTSEKKKKRALRKRRQNRSTRSEVQMKEKNIVTQREEKRRHK